MAMVRDTLTLAEREERRKQAVEILERGFSKEEVSNIFNVSVYSIREWKKLYDENGMSGLEGPNRSREYLEYVSTDKLFNMLSYSENSEVTKRIMMAINHKQQRGITTKQLGERYRVPAEVVREWLSLFEDIEGKSIEQSIQLISDKRDDKSIEVEELDRNKKELAARRKEAVRLLGQDFTVEEVSNIFDVNISSIRRWRYIYEHQGWKGLEASRQPARGEATPHLEDVSADYLRNLLAEVENKKSAQRVMLALHYKENNIVSQKRLSNIYGMSEESVADSLFRVEQCEDEPTNEAIIDGIPEEQKERLERPLPERTREEFDARRKEALRALSCGISPKQVAEVFDVTTATLHRWKMIYNQEGIDSLKLKSSGRNSTFLKNISIDYLQNILSDVESKKAAQRIMVAIIYKQEEYTTQKDICEKFGFGERTVLTWLSRLDRLEEEPFEDVVYDSPTGEGPRKIPKEKIPQLEAIFQNNPEDYGFDGEYWTSTRAIEVIEENIGKSVSSSTASRYLNNAISNDTYNYSIVDKGMTDMGSLKETSRESLLSKFKEIRDRPTERLMAGILYKQGFSAPKIADWFDRDSTTLYRWFDLFENNSLDDAIYDDNREGRSKKLPEEKFPELEKKLKKGAEEYGFTGQIWTGPRIAQVIEEEFGISVAAKTARRYVKQFGWSRQKPHQRFNQRDEEEIKQFRNKKWPNIRENAKKCGETIVFIDETKFRLLPTFKKTWAPEGETPAVETSGLFSFVAAIGAVTYTPVNKQFNFQWRTQRYGFENQSIHRFFDDIMNDISSNAVFLLDNWSPHKSALNEFEDTAINIEWFPEYASDINPVDSVWGQAKYQKLANYTPKNLDELEPKVNEVFRDIQSEKKTLRYCIKESGLEIEA